MSDAAILNVNEGDEFYIRFKSSYRMKTLSSREWRFVNYNEIPSALENFNKNGTAFKQEKKSFFMGQTVTSYYKFKALKTSYNEITLKFQYSNTGHDLEKPEYYVKNIRVDILPKQ